MALATRCPHCQTTFRVANDQLKLHSGLVRCGACQQTFNGVEHLIPIDGVKTVALSPISHPEDAHPAVDENLRVTPVSPQPGLPEAASAPAKSTEPVFKAEPDPIPSPLAEPPVSQVSAELSTPPGTDDIVSSDIDFDLGESGLDADFSEAPLETVAAKIELETRAALLSEPDIDWSKAEMDVPEVAPELPPDIPSLLSEPTLQVTAEEPASEAGAELTEPYIGEAESALESHAISEPDSISDANDDKPDFVLKAEREQRLGRILKIAMLSASVLLLPLLLAQFAYIFRVQLSANFPETRPMLQQACSLLHCTIGLPAQIEQITLESNELQEQSPGKNVFALSIQLQNHSNLTQAWPHVELVLNDKKDKPVLQKAFAAKDYLNNQAELDKGFAANSEKNIKIYFQLPKLSAAGYHVGIFYP